MRSGQARERAEAGDTLVELMITVAILGLAMVAILGAIWTTLRIADYNSKTSNADAALRAYAETMKEGGDADAYKYVPCTVAGGTVAYPAYTPSAPYDDYDATVTAIRYLSGYSVDAEPVWSNACPAADLGLQEITLRVVGPNSDPEVRGKETLTIVKRDARCDVPNDGILPGHCTETP